MDLLSILNDSAKSKQEKIDSIGITRDLLDYGDLNVEEAVKIMDMLVKYVVVQEDNDIREAMLNAILEGENSHDIGKELDLSPIVSHLSVFNDECISYILTMMGYSGKEEYRGIMESFKHNPRLEDDVAEALLELNHAQK
ncbi:hypothetical protein HB943_04370 [Listeria weihenstephanensis]|uniref:Immunity protein 30 domain-containing protein n=1 Tax=Listeria weihenstephanensis TaxID=1006155 RepID=A0A841Z3P6_9LIST|nr:hypothetical protein [Listeria weihenstephanensis]MBC1499828.1 hypothetical protein [Listeria weihenstephanensis]